VSLIRTRQRSHTALCAYQWPPGHFKAQGQLRAFPISVGAELTLSRSRSRVCDYNLQLHRTVHTFQPNSLVFPTDLALFLLT